MIREQEQGSACAGHAGDRTPVGPGEAYRCVRCVSALEVSDAGLRCPRCAWTFPVVGGVPILAHRPDALLAAAQGSLDEAGSRLERTKSTLSTANAREWPDGLAERALRMVRGTEKNLEVLRAYMAPVARYLSDCPRRPASALDWITAHTGGWDAQAMLPYFYQDWRPTPAAREAAALIADTLVMDRPDAQAVAVLGAGACGVLHAVREHFDTVYGIDLSIPTILLAKGVLSGDAIVLHFRQTQWRPVRVAGPSSTAARTRLVVADAAALPFDDASLSAVVTQYLLDVVGNPLAVAAEISRVLKPGGVWINFSTPFSLPHEPAWVDPPRLGELSRVLEPFGFELHVRERRHFTLLDLTGIDPATSKVIEDVFFFAARRTAQGNRPGAGAPFSARSTGDCEESWNSIPTLLPGRQVHLVRRTVYTHPARSHRLEIGVGKRVAWGSPESGAIVDALLSEIDGTHTAREILTRLTAAGWTMSAGEFLELLACLCWHHGVLDVRAA